jgi:hypothetical protein
MDDIKILWEKGVEMMDASLRKKFTLKDIIFVTITDYPGLFSLLGQIKGKTNYVVCIDGTCYTYLIGSNKMVYMRHRRFLVKKNRYRKDTMNKYFNNLAKPQLDEPKWTRYEKKVFGMSRTWRLSWNRPNYKSISTKTITEVIKLSYLNPYNSGSPMKSRGISNQPTYKPRS